MKSGGIDNIATHLAAMKLGSDRNPLTVSAATSSTSYASIMVASSSARKTESRYLLDAGALYHGKEKENTPPLGSSLASSRDDELDIPILQHGYLHREETSVDTFFSALSSRWNESSWNQFSSTDCGDH